MFGPTGAPGNVLRPSELLEWIEESYKYNTLSITGEKGDKGAQCNLFPVESVNERHILELLNW